MSNDYYVPPLSRVELEERAYAWRQALGISAESACPDMVSVLEINLPRLFPAVSISVRRSFPEANVEAFTQHEPPMIAIREDVYRAASKFEGRARMTLAHELGHLVLHKSAVPLHRAPEKYKAMDNLPHYASAEYQANEFASYFLIPEWIVLEFENPSDLSDYCKTTYRASEVRLGKVTVRPIKKLPEVVRVTLDEFRS